jgi:hypothetical protein
MVDSSDVNASRLWLGENTTTLIQQFQKQTFLRRLVPKGVANMRQGLGLEHSSKFSGYVFQRMAVLFPHISGGGGSEGKDGKFKPKGLAKLEHSFKFSRYVFQGMPILFPDISGGGRLGRKRRKTQATRASKT